MNRGDAITEAKRIARWLGEGSSVWAVQTADGSYLVTTGRKPGLRGSNLEVIRCDWDGMTYPD